MPQSEKNKRWWTAFGLATVFLLAQWNHEFRRAASYGTESTYDSEERVNAWLLSALCFQKTRIPLVICGPKGRLLPIEDVSIADDRGHAVLSAGAALFKSSPVTRVTLVKINLSINAIGIFLLALMCMMVGLPWAALGSLVLGYCYGLPGPIPGHDAPASYFGVFCLVALVVVWIAAYDVAPYSKGQLWMGSALSLFSLAGAFLLRQPIGLAGALAAALLLVYPFRPKKLVIGGALIFMASRASPALLELRNVIYKIPETSSYHSHGIWHALYLGLGWNSNPWGIVWDDRYGAQIARQINPQAHYGTYAYYRIIQGLYWHIVTTDPGAVLKVYGHKFCQTWNFPLLIMRVRISTWLLILTGLAAAIFKKTPPQAQYPLRTIFSLGVLYLIISIQGVLAAPTGTHLYPLKMGVLLMMALWADYLRLLGLVTRKRDDPLNGGDKRR